MITQTTKHINNTYHWLNMLPKKCTQLRICINILILNDKQCIKCSYFPNWPLILQGIESDERVAAVKKKLGFKITLSFYSSLFRVLFLPLFLVKLGLGRAIKHRLGFSWKQKLVFFFCFWTGLPHSKHLFIWSQACFVSCSFWAWYVGWSELNHFSTMIVLQHMSIDLELVPISNFLALLHNVGMQTTQCMVLSIGICAFLESFIIELYSNNWWHGSKSLASMCRSCHILVFSL